MNFEPTRIPVAVINRDSDGQLAQGLVDYLGQTSRLVPYPDDPEKLQDALFFRNVEYIAIIPAGFSDAFMSGRDCAIEKVIVPDSTSSYYVDMSIDRFLNTVRLHRKYGGEESQAELVAAARADLAFDTAVAMKSSGAATGGRTSSVYLLLCVLRLCVAGHGHDGSKLNHDSLQQARSVPAQLVLRHCRAEHELAAGCRTRRSSLWVAGPYSC
jgi:hypothetical protein